ncbi:hypothetical protein QL285_090454 [Trifolium repens]|nr:hypothetical protein QL285_090454 [Trifolium repens]
MRFGFIVGLTYQFIFKSKKDRRLQLPGSFYMAHRVKNIFVNRLKFKPHNVDLLTDSYKPVHKNLAVQRLQNMIKKLKNGDEMILFTGHGFTEQDSLLPSPILN